MKKYQGAFIKNEREIACLREANRMVANILDAIGDIVKPGETTMRFEELARDMCADYKVKPAFLGYYGYPYATCCSVNEQVVHGFPSPRLLEEGDIVSVDMGVVFEGFVGDAARTFPVGKVSEEACKLMRVTEESLYVGIEQAQQVKAVVLLAVEGSKAVDVQVLALGGHPQAGVLARTHQPRAIYQGRAQVVDRAGDEQLFERGVRKRGVLNDAQALVEPRMLQLAAAEEGLLADVHQGGRRVELADAGVVEGKVADAFHAAG